MSQNQANVYSMDPHIAEIYDQQEHQQDDVRLLLDLIGGRGPWDIFEPFCGTGRILIPLVQAGHRLIGLDQSYILLDRCRKKLTGLSITAGLIEGDVISSHWPAGFDLVVVGGNALYELATLGEQESCIRFAAAALKPGGYLFLDNDHMEGELPLSWQDPAARPSFPSGVCSDGVRLESTIQTIWFDAPARLARFKRRMKAFFPDGQTVERAVTQQKHPPSTGEMQGWLEKYGFTVECFYGSRDRQPYNYTSSRAIFWARL